MFYTMLLCIGSLNLSQIGSMIFKFPLTYKWHAERYLVKTCNSIISNSYTMFCPPVVVVELLFYVHGKHLRSCRDGQLT